MSQDDMTDDEKLAADWANDLDEQSFDNAEADEADFGLDAPDDEDAKLADEWAATLAEDEQEAVNTARSTLSASVMEPEFRDLTEASRMGQQEGQKRELDFILDIPLDVSVELGIDKITASEAEINLNDLTGFLRNGTVFMKSNHIYFTGEYVEKHHGEKYSFTNANITACDPSSPFWELSAESAIIELDGSSTLTSTRAKVAFIKTPSIPYASFSIDKKRQSGFLMPRPGYSSALGLHGTIPFFWDISQERDLTLAASYFNLTGSMATLVYRSYTDLNDKTWLGIDYLFSDATFNNLQINEDNRYWIRGMLGGEIYSSDWFYKLNLDYVSDSTFLALYKSTYYGYTKTIDETYNFFGRDFAQITKNRVSEGYIYRYWQNILLSMGFKYSQNPLYGDTLAFSEDTTVQTPADIAAYVLPVNIFPFLQFDGMTEFTYNYRVSGISGAETLVQPRVSAPLDIGFISVLPQISLIQRNYFASTEDLTDAPLGDPTENNKLDSNTLFTFKVDSMLQASRIWHIDNDNILEANSENIGKSQTTAIQHLLEPMLSYALTPYSNQDALPYYNQDDRILEQSELSFTLRNAVVSRRETINPTINDPENAAYKSTSFHSLLNLSLTARYNFEEERRTKYVDEYPKRPFRDIEINAQFYPYGLNFSAYSTISVYGDGITRFDLSTKVPLFALERFIKWNTALTYRNTMYDYQNIVQYSTSEDIDLSDEVMLLKNSFVITPIESIKLNLGLYRDLYDTQSYEIDTRLTYYHDCFEIAVKYSYSPIDQSVGLVLSIPGILN